MKRISVAVVLAVLLATWLVAGCGGEEGVSTTTSSPESVTTSSPESVTTSSLAPPTVSTEAPGGAQKYGGTARITFFPLIQNAGGLPWELWGPQTVFAQIAMEPLFEGTPKGELVPWLAESYELADDLKSITIVLKQGIKFHDGSELNAEVVQWNITNYIAAGINPNWKAAEVVDPRTVRIDFVAWSNTNLTGLRDGCWIASKQTYDKNGEEYARNNPCGTGPFKFVSFENGVKMVLEKNPDYWIEGKPYLDGVECLFVADAMTHGAMLQAGEADIIANQFLNKEARDLEAKGFSIQADRPSTNCLIPDAGNADSPFKDQKVREAVEYAIDREAIAAAFSYGFWEAQDQIPGPDATIFNPNFNLGRKYDPDKAKQLLAEAGYPDGFKTTLIYPTGLVDENLAVAVQQMLLAVGIDAELKSALNQAKANEDMNTIHNNLSIQAVSPLSGSWNRCYEYTFMANAANATNAHWLRSSEWMALAQKSMATPTEDLALAQAVADQWVKEASVIEVSAGGIGFAVAPYVKDGGFFSRSFSPWIKLYNMWLDK